METKTYSFTKTLTKGVVAFLLFAIPFFISNYSEVANLTIGAVAVMALNALKFYAKQNLNL